MPNIFVSFPQVVSLELEIGLSDADNGLLSSSRRVSGVLRHVFYRPKFDPSMEYDSVADLGDKDVINMTNEGAASNPPEMCVKDVTIQDTNALKNMEQVKIGKQDVTPGVSFGNEYAAGEVNMEATITTDDVIRAGGFGATDNIGIFLPVAMDSTDFEASLRDAMDFEESQAQKSRPGLGWTEVTESEDS
ncbi:uncharacterized protein LOC143891642 [Tasmannia lanceolata]|uniref:uncharacterized protein LOC143891642 n=1 Tax=Tasmannia lanceolata TaxID=3420 RepID=UPI0040645267